jgi:copper chaperone CopZ
MKLVLLPTLLFLMLSCAQSSQSDKKNELQPKVCKTTIANTTISLGVKGMVCQMGCGGSIRKALKATCAVERVEVNYIDSLEEQTIIVHYDRQKLGPVQMIKLLTELNDKQFSVRTISEPKAVK